MNEYLQIIEVEECGIASEIIMEVFDELILCHVMTCNITVQEHKSWH
jgi:hypothetical protein